jgi:hypothetical protein
MKNVVSRHGLVSDESFIYMAGIFSNVFSDSATQAGHVTSQDGLDFICNSTHNLDETELPPVTKTSRLMQIRKCPLLFLESCENISRVGNVSAVIVKLVVHISTT